MAGGTTQDAPWEYCVDLVEVMAAYRPTPMTVSVLYPNRRQRSRRLGAFIDWFTTLMAPYLKG
jgi:DNA-binding transcriptional LysR family regulator